MKQMSIQTKLVALFILLCALPINIQAATGTPDCSPGRDLVDIPEIRSKSGLLKGMIMLKDEERAMAGNASGTECDWQHLRYFKGYSMDAANQDDGTTGAWPAGGDILPGPTLRGKVGDLVQIAFLNQIDLANFPFSLDQAEQGKSEGCDISRAQRKNNPDQSREIYPSNPNQDGGGDTHPNCLHGSSTANIHYHGSHTSPSTTADNVLLFVRPALSGPKPSWTELSSIFQDIWNTCAENGSPTSWEQLPEAWREGQLALIKEYDDTAAYKGVPGALPPSMRLLPKTLKQIKDGVWPQYSIGAFPYCFRLPAYDSTYPGIPQKTLMGQAPGTHWYHAHKHGSTALNVGNGMAGVFVIEGDYDQDLRNYYGENLVDKVLVIQQLQTSLGLLSAGDGKAGPPPLSVNGRLNPVVTMAPGEMQLWRIANTAARDFVKFASFAQHGPNSSTVQWRQIAQDGVQYAFENYQRVGTLNNQFTLAPANRADLLVKAPTQPGTYALTVKSGAVSDAPGSGSDYTLLTVKVEGSKKKQRRSDFIKDKKDFPVFPAFLEDITERPVISRTLVYNTDPGPARKGQGKMPQHKINNEQFSGEHVDQTMTLDTVEEWKLVNETVGIAHPFHIHINPFQVFEVFQPTACADSIDPADPRTWVPCQNLTPPYIWWDTLAIPSAANMNVDESVCTTKPACPAAIQPYVSCSEGKCSVKIPGYFKMRSRFVDFTGMYVNHCHILAHEDRGMMELIEVIPKRTTKYFHH